MLKEYVVINYENEECVGDIAIATKTYDAKKKEWKSNSTLIDKVTKRLLKKKWKKFSQKKVVIDNE